MTAATDRLGPAARGLGEPDITCAAPTCRRRPNHGPLCDGDAALLGQWLAEIGDTWLRLDAEPTNNGPTGGRGGSLASHRTPGRLDVIALKDPRTALDHDTRTLSVPAVLGEWADTVREARNLAIPTVTRVFWRGGRLVQTTGRAAYDVPTDRAVLAAHLDWILGQEWVGDLWADVRAAWAALKAATGDGEGQPVRKGHQGEDGVHCAGSVRLNRGAAYCSTCGAVWSGFQLVRLAAGSAA